MKIKFEENLEYQIDAINAITDIFSGQETAKTVFTVEKSNNPQLSIVADENDLGTGNKLLLLPEEISENLNNIQTRNGLAKTEVLGKNTYNFSIEMETGTGKTYVYLRTIMELNKKYGFTKFIIVVPSLAIKEGVYKTLQITNRFKLPDIITYLQNETNLTRKSIVRILTESKTLNSFKKNPQLYLEQASDIMKRTMRLFIVDGIKYEKIGDVEYYSQELFENNEIFGYLKDEMNRQGNMVKTEKTPYSSIIIDSEIERKFAEGLENNGNIKVYTKLPDWFKIATPLGNYNPDWAVLVQEPNQNKEKLYFVVETKGTTSEEGRRDLENLKINCGRKHFEALKVDYSDCDSISNFKIYIEKIKEKNKQDN